MYVRILSRDETPARMETPSQEVLAGVTGGADETENISLVGKKKALNAFRRRDFDYSMRCCERATRSQEMTLLYYSFFLSIPMAKLTLNDLLKLAKDYRGEGTHAVDPYSGDMKIPHNFREHFLLPSNPHLAALALRLRYANMTSFNAEGQTISNTTPDGVAILSPSHTFPHSQCTWDNTNGDPLGFTKYYMGESIIIRKSKLKGDWMKLHMEDDTAEHPDFWFVINLNRVAIHHKVLSDGSFELEIMNPTWIIGYIK